LATTDSSCQQLPSILLFYYFGFGAATQIVPPTGWFYRTPLPTSFGCAPQDARGDGGNNATH